MWFHMRFVKESDLEIVKKCHNVKKTQSSFFRKFNNLLTLLLRKKLRLIEKKQEFTGFYVTNIVVKMLVDYYHIRFNHTIMFVYFIELRNCLHNK